ncbi:barstar family protein [Paenibacillus tyrfis]|uniref:barstar family protein n=1 Tax=Paenibacillus tyrfis TaxID=1501230 RepID=UPI00209C83C0|nr:barstar family protein [Paenibacillus tyrfis]MCP1309668.1 barstar family protein [Paenibacillus tyrfis]
MKKITIDGVEFVSYDTTHNILRGKLVKKEHLKHTYWGNNLDSMWEFFTDFLESPLTIEWKNYDIAVKNLGTYAEKILDIFLELEQKKPGFKIIIISET